MIALTVLTIGHNGYALAKDGLNRGSFPKGFVFGTASSAFQYEGAVKVDNRGSSIWDKYAQTYGKISDFSNADVADDQYHRYHEDIGLMKDMGMDAYRFSISWTRIFPSIEPYVTIFHWDSPQALENIYKGWLGPQIIKDFAVYAETLFEIFGDRVKHWITLNEPHNFAFQGYDMGLAAPGRCSVFLHLRCREGNSSTEPYNVAHHLLISHATVVDIYRKKYQKAQGGSIGVSLDVVWYEPATNSSKDIKATQRAMDFQLGWFLDPMMYGDYPNSMKERVGDRLPRFSAAESALLKGSLDFVGINHYTSYYVRDNNKVVSSIGKVFLKNTLSDSGTTALPLGHDGRLIGEKANSIWLYIVPWGMRRLMNYIKQRYGNPTVVITENGMDEPNIPFLPIGLALEDEKRIKYHHDYLENLAAAINDDGCNVKGYFAWSLLDNWEWAAGYSSRFGLYFVDYHDNLKRYPKHSSQWFKNFLNSQYT